MRLVSFQLPADGIIARLGLVLDPEHVLDMAGALPDTTWDGTASRGLLASMNAFLASGETGLDLAKRLRDWALGRRNGSVARPWLLRRESIRLLPPVPKPSKIIATGRNFIAHLLEGNAARRARGEPEVSVPRAPTAFVKLADCLVASGDPIPYPPETRELDYEGEIGAVIGRPAQAVPASEAMRYVAGYQVFNDISARDVQREEMRAGLLLLGKNFPGFGPMGPELVLADEVRDPGDLRIRTWVNGELRQDGSTHEMYFRWADLVAYWSRLSLQPGDIITSGTPAGVAMGHSPEWYLKPGDLVEVEVEGLGRLSNRVEAAR